MRPRRKITNLLTLALSATLILWGYIHFMPLTLATPRDLSEVQTGDIILTVGHSFKSDIVRVFEKKVLNCEEYSHIGIFY